LHSSTATAEDDGLLFAVGSVVRARVRAVNTSETAVVSAENGGDLKFLPYSVLHAASGGDVTPLLRLSGTFVVPQTLVDDILAPALRIGGNGGGSGDPSKMLMAGKNGDGEEELTSMGDDNNQVVNLVKKSSSEDEDKETSLSLSTAAVEAVSLSQALVGGLGRYDGEGGDEAAAAQEAVAKLSRRRQSLDVLELPPMVPNGSGGGGGGAAATAAGDASSPSLPSTDSAENGDHHRQKRRPPVLAPIGTQPPLSSLGAALFSCVSRGDIKELRAMANNKNKIVVDLFRTVHPEHGASVMHLAATAINTSAATDDEHEDEDAHDQLGNGSDETAAGLQTATTEKGRDGGSTSLMAGSNTRREANIMPTFRQRLLEVLWSECVGAKDMINARATNGATPLVRNKTFDAFF
jgi:hypothetical protein